MPEIHFPAGFIWGAATSAYQIEGAWNADGKGESVWDRFCHSTWRVDGNDHGDVACDHYHRYAEDVALLKNLGVHSYRFSTAWTRVLPEGRGRVNPAGLGFYDRLVDALLEAGIQPNLTLNHWDLPQALQEMGGWNNRECVNWFTDYARVMLDALGDRVRMWSTHNEPWVAAFLGYQSAGMAPGIADSSQAYQAAHHLLLSHGRTVQLFRQGGYPGEIGIVLNVSHSQPASDRPADVAAFQRSYESGLALFAQPLFHGTYPQMLMDWLGAMAPRVEPGDMETIHTPIDFLGLNYYFSTAISYDTHGGLLKARQDHITMPMWGHTEMGWGVYWEGLHQLLLHFKEQYCNPRMFITENGCAALDKPDADGFVQDDERIDYIRHHLKAAHEAIEAGVRLDGYYVWSLLDNFEWWDGYRPRFGIIRVDYDSLRRTPKASYNWYREVIARNGLAW